MWSWNSSFYFFSQLGTYRPVHVRMHSSYVQGTISMCSALNLVVGEGGYRRWACALPSGYLKGYILSFKGSNFGLVQICVRTDILDQHCTVDTYTRIRRTHRVLLYEIKLFNSKRRPLDCNFTNAARFVWQTSAPKLYSVVVNIPCWSLRAIMLPNFSNLYRPGTEYENQW